MFFYSEAIEQIGPTDPSFSNVSLLLKADGANGSTNFVDDSTNNFAISALRSAQISTTQSKYGGSSAYLSGGSQSGPTSHHYSSADYLSAPSAYDIITTGPFTIEAWIYKTNNNLVAICGTFNWSNGNNSGWYLGVGADNKLILRGSNGTWNSTSAIVTSSGTVPMGQWVHVAATRDGSNAVRIFINGQLQGTTLDYSHTLNRIGAQNTSVLRYALRVGAYLSDSYVVAAFIGYIDDLRITSGVARYTDNFTPPDSLPTTGV
jgi:hypothetical protein